MEIKDLSMDVERMEEVRGGFQWADMYQSQSLVGANTGVANADASFSVGGGAAAGNNIVNPQSAVQVGDQSMSKVLAHGLSINDSVVFPFGL